MMLDHYRNNKNMLISYDKRAMGFFQEIISRRWIRVNADFIFDLRSPVTGKVLKSIMFQANKSVSKITQSRRYLSAFSKRRVGFAIEIRLAKSKSH